MKVEYAVDPKPKTIEDLEFGDVFEWEGDWYLLTALGTSGLQTYVTHPYYAVDLSTGALIDFMGAVDEPVTFLPDATLKI